MGWFGYGPIDGDDGMDLQDIVFGMIGVTEENSDNEIRVLLEENQDEIYYWIRDYDWDKNHSHNPGFIQTAYIQALAYIMCSYKAKINEIGMTVFVDFTENDVWAKKEPERKKEMDKLLNMLKENSE